MKHSIFDQDFDPCYRCKYNSTVSYKMNIQNKIKAELIHPGYCEHHKKIIDSNEQVKKCKNFLESEKRKKTYVTREKIIELMTLRPNKSSAFILTTADFK